MNAEPSRRIVTYGEPCRADIHEWCDVAWCVCACHLVAEEQSA